LARLGSEIFEQPATWIFINLLVGSSGFVLRENYASIADDDGQIL
jgi:hypothetical protein